MQGFATQSLIGRTHALQSVLSSLRRTGSRGALIIGDAGMGKSALAGQVIDQLEPDYTVHRVHASSSLTAIPYGALAPLLPDLTAGDTDSPLAVMRALMQRFYPAGSETGSNPLVVVDDAHLLDEASADLLSQLVASAQIPMLILARSIRELPSAFPAQAWDGLITRHHLPPLTEEQIHELCVQVLGGPVLGATSTEVARMSGGNPMFALALLDETVRSGGLECRHGVWMLIENVLPPEGRLGDLLRAQLSVLEPQEREALEIISLAEPLPLASAFQLGLHGPVDALTEAKLVSVSDGPQRLLRPRHPLYGEVVRRMVPAARSARLRQRLLTVLTDEDQTLDGLLRFVGWSLDCGAPVPDAQLLQAVSMANNFGDTDFALRAAAAVSDPALSAAVRVQTAAAYFQRGNLVRAGELLSGVAEEANDFTTLKVAVVLSLQIRKQVGAGPEDLQSLAADWAAGLDRLEAAGATGSLTEFTADLVSSRRGCRLLTLYATVLDGGFASAEMELGDVLAAARQADDDEAALVALALLGEVHVAVGQALAGAAATREALELLLRGGHRFLTYYHFVLHRHLSALLWLGEWEEIRAVVAQGMGVPRQVLGQGGTADFCLAVMHLRRNEWDQAVVRLTTAIEGLRLSDPEGLLPIAAAVGAIAAARQGLLEKAHELLGELASIGQHSSRHYALMAQGHAAAARIILGSFPEAGRDLRELAAEAEEAGFLATEFDLRAMAVRLGDTSSMSRLVKVTEGFDGPMARVLNRFARVLLDQDIEELLNFAAEPLQPEWEPLARACLDEALRLARKGKDRGLVNRVQRIAGRHTGHGSGRNHRTGAPVLTRRERDVAGLVVEGHRNAEIADRLFLSVRTVEGHIYRTFEKLGISRREELKEAMEALDR